MNGEKKTCSKTKCSVQYLLDIMVLLKKYYSNILSERTSGKPYRAAGRMKVFAAHVML